MSQIVVLGASESPPEGADFVLVTIDTSGLQVVSNVAGGTIFSAPNTEEALGDALTRGCALADARGLIVYVRLEAMTAAAQKRKRIRPPRTLKIPGR